MKRFLLFFLLVAAAAGGGAYYYYVWAPQRARQAAPAAPPAPPPPQVAVIEVRPREVPLTFTYAGRVEGFRSVEVRAQVGGVLLKREYEEGSRVERGQTLFRIDPRTYQATLDRANAQLAQAQATLRQAEEALRRTEELQQRQVSTAAQLDTARAARDQAAAGVQLARAEIQAQTLNLDFTTVNAPVAGITALTSPPEGTLVQAQSTLLTTITQLDPAYVNFSITDTEYQQFRALNQRLARPLTMADITVTLIQGDGTPYPQKGRIDVSAQSIDPRTGTLQIRAIFPNADGAILPGQFVRVLTEGVTLPDTVTVPQAAVSQGPQGPFVYVLGENNVAAVRPIRLGREVGPEWVVQQGLSAGDRLVADGVMRVRPNAPVTPAPPQSRPAGGQPAAAATPGAASPGAGGPPTPAAAPQGGGTPPPQAGAPPAQAGPPAAVPALPAPGSAGASAGAGSNAGQGSRP